MVFLDYASTNLVVKYPQRLYRDVLGEGYFFNPNANYAYKEKKLLAEAENRVKKVIGAKSGKVVFGGTSSQLIENLMNAIFASQYNYDVFCSDYEHDSFFRYNDDSFHDANGLNLLLAETDKYIIPIVMWQAVQNLTGEIFSQKKIGELVRLYKGYYICDGTAQLGHAPIESDVDDWCDAYIASGHKLGTELGIGFIWISDRLNKFIGDFKLHGTPNLAGALAMTQAIEGACDKWPLHERIWHYADLANCLNDGLIKNNIEFNTVPEYPDNDEPPFAYAINAIRLPGIDANALQQYLASKQIYIGVGHSSCADNKDFRILQYGYGLSEKGASEVIRISFGENSNETDILALAQGVKEFKEKFV